MSKMNIRTAKEEDAERLLGIYTPYITDTAITFEYEVPSIGEFRQRINNTLKKYPYLVAEDENGNLVGYAYAGVFKGRAAYDWAVETSIYVKQSEAGKGLGRLLHDTLQKELQQMGILNMYACISAPRGTDPYLTDNSIQFHSHLGYRIVGRFAQCGYKFNRWYDMVWMEKHIGAHTEKVKPVSFIDNTNEDFATSREGSLNKVRITAVRQTIYPDLMEKYENPIEHTCDMAEGQQWISVDGKCPNGMCPSAWGAMREFVESLAKGEGDFYDGWMKNPMSAMISCNDGFRPFSFFIEVME